MFKNRAIKKYFNQFYPFLKQRYGASETYTKGQIIRTISECGFKEMYAVYALAIFLDKTSFENLANEYPNVNLLEVRKEIADKFFNGNAEYSYKQAMVRFVGNDGHESIGGSAGTGSD